MQLDNRSPILVFHDWRDILYMTGAMTATDKVTVVVVCCDLFRCFRFRVAFLRADRVVRRPHGDQRRRRLRRDRPILELLIVMSDRSRKVQARDLRPALRRHPKKVAHCTGSIVARTV